MYVFVFVLFSSCSLCWLAQLRPKYEPDIGGRSVATSKICGYLIASTVIILFFAVCRADSVGVDLKNYKRHFLEVAVGKYNSFEPAYLLLETLVAWWTDNFNVFMTFCSILTLLPMLLVLYKEIKTSLWLGMLIFIAEVYAASFGLLRVMLSCMCLYAAYFMKCRSRFFYFLFLFLAVLFHYSSLCMVLVFLVFGKKRMSSHLCLIVAVVTLLLMHTKSIVDSLLPLIYERYQKYFLLGDTGRYQSYVPALNFFLFGFLTLLCWVYRDKLMIKNSKNSLLINLSAVGLCLTVGLYWFSMTIRLIQMFRCFLPFLIPQLIACEENRIFRRLITGAFAILYLIMFVIFVTGRNSVLPYRFFWQS